MAGADWNWFTSAEDPVALLLQGHEPRLLAGLRTHARRKKWQFRGRAAGHAPSHTDNVSVTKVGFCVSSGTKVRRGQFTPVAATAAAIAVLAAAAATVSAAAVAAVVVEHWRDTRGPELCRVPARRSDGRRPQAGVKLVPGNRRCSRLLKLLLIGEASVASPAVLGGVSAAEKVFDISG